MANDFSINPWVIDTAGAGVLTTEKLRLSRIRWDGATTSGHTAIVNDKNSKRVWSSTSDATPGSPDDALFDENEPMVDGLIVPTLASGRLLIYLR